MRPIKAAIGLGLVSLSVIASIGWFAFRIYVPTNKCAVLIKKTGEMLPEGESVATNENQRGIQQEVLGPGRHFRDPFRWEWKLVDQQVIPAGDPMKWRFNARIVSTEPNAIRKVMASMEKDLPKIGVVTRRVGKRPPPGQLVVKRSSGYQGILEEVLTPGTYKLNPNVYEVELYPATVVPTGFVGVVTNLMDSRTSSAALAPGLPSAPSQPAPAPAAAPEETEAHPELEMHVRPLAAAGQRGTLRDVLQPGIYFINPKVKKVTLIEVGFHEYSQHLLKTSQSQQISFPSDTGFLITIGVTVVWGIDPSHAAEIINEFGNVDGVLDKVIAPQLRSICRNIGSTYAARDFIQGEKRELFQQDLTRELQRICRAKNIEVLLALVREIEVHAPSQSGETGTNVMEDLKRTIQQSYIATESRITKDKQREAATVKAKLEESKKKVDIARETIKAETRVMTAGIAAEGAKTAAEVDAQAALEVAAIQQQVAELDAQRIEIMGQARADVERMKNDAESEGYRILVEAFGSPQAYNLYTFAENFAPESIKLFYAGEGTFWTDLSRLEELGAAKLLQPDSKSK